MRKVRWGVLGTADIARGATIPGMLEADGCELYAIAGRSMEKARLFQSRFGFQKAYDSYAALLEDPLVEAVYIPLPNSLHAEWSIRALQKKKHVLCEKPLAVSERQAREMFQAARENGVLLMEAFAYLHSPFVEAVEKEIGDGAIGDVVYLESAFIGGPRPPEDIRMRRETYGGALYDLGCYPVSMALRLLKQEPREVRASAVFSAQGIDLCTAGILAFPSGAVAAVNCAMALRESRLDRFRVYGTRGYIVSDAEFNQAGEIRYTLTRDGRDCIKTVTAKNNYRLEVEQLSRCILLGEEPLVTEEFSLLTARTMDRLLAAIGY